MKVVIFNDRLDSYGGAESYVHQTSKAISREHDVYKIGFESDGKSSGYTIKRPDGLQRVFHGYYFHIPTYKKLKNKIDSINPDVIQLNMNLLSPVSVLLAVKDYPIVKTAHTFNMVSYSDWFQKKKFNLENVLRKYIFMSYQESIINQMRKEYVDIFTAPSKRLADMIQSKFGKCTFLPNYTDNTNYSTDRDDFILFVGRIVQEKGIGDLIESIKYVSNDIDVKIAGDGPDMSQIKKKARESPVGDQISVLGYITNEKLDELFKKCRATVIPSTWLENNPLVGIEAIARGSPLIVSMIGGLEDLVDNENGLCFSPGNKKELAKKIDEIQSRNLESMCMNSRNLFEKRYTKHNHMNELTNIFYRLHYE